MNNSRFAAVTEILGVAAVVLSLIFVGMEIRQAADINSAQTVLSLNQSTSELLQQLASNDELAGLIIRASNDYASLNAEEQVRAGFWFRSVINNHESAWKYHSKGLMDDMDHQAWIRSFCDGLMQREGARREWLTSNEVYSRDFVDEYNFNCGFSDD